jgi:hypothetical protein
VNWSIRRSYRYPHRFLALGFGVASALSVAPLQAQEMCGGAPYPFPYTDVSGVGAAFCPGIMEAYVTGVSKGTTPTTFSPNTTVTRVQMTTFLQRSLDQALERSARRGALNQWSSPQNGNAMQAIPVGGIPWYCAADGNSIWIATQDQVLQVRASTGAVLGTWTGASQSYNVARAAGQVFVTGETSPGTLYVIDPTQPPGPLTVAANNLGDNPAGIAFDGTNLWTANHAASVSIITPQPPYTVTTVASGFLEPVGILYDGTHIWVVDSAAGELLQLDATGAILLAVPVGESPLSPVFDGANIWVPNYNGNSITVVQASSGSVVATITGDATNKLNGPFAASFDGERILVTNYDGYSVTVFKAADLSFLANVAIGSGTPSPTGACSDGINFWIAINNTGNLLRF